MKVLFAIGDAVTSENIVKQYYSLYGEKIEYKNVFYFKALLEEVKRDKTYDRIVIAEQLEPPQRNVVDAIDQMIFNNIDSVTDEIQDSTIIFICSDGRTKNDSLIGRLFNIGIYNLLMGDERDIVPLCGLIKEPRNKKEAKEYLKSNPAIGGAATISKNDDQVDELELLNISKYFNNLKTKEDYLSKFAIVEEQYNERQLQIIVTALYKNLKRGREIYETLQSDSRYSRYCVLPNYVSNNSSNPIDANKNAPSKVGGILGFLSGKKMKANENSGIDRQLMKNRIEDANEIADKASEEAKNIMDREQQQAKELAEQLRKESEERRRLEREQEAQIKNQQEAQLKAQQEAQLKAQQEAQLKAQQEAQLKAQQEAQLKAQQEAQLKAQQEAQLKAQQEAQLKAQQEAQLKAQQEAQLKAQQEAQLKAQQEAQLKAQQEAQLKAQQEAQLKAQQEAQLKAQQEAQLKAQQEAQLKAQQEAQLKAQQEAQLKAQQEAQLKAQQEAQLKAQQEAQLKAQQEAQLKAQQEAQLKAQQEAQLKAQQEARFKAEQEAQLKAQQEARFKAEQERLQAERENLKQQQESMQGYYGTPTNGMINNSNYINNMNTNVMQHNNFDSNINDDNSNEPIDTPQLMVPMDYKKVIAFVGTNKVGTTFLVNTLASLMAMKGVKTSVLDMTKNRGMYWYYSGTMEKKKSVVSSCMSNLTNGTATPIQIGKYKNLNLYTTIPGGKEDNRKSYKHRTVIETAKKGCNLLIIDCDFSTPYDYLEAASEIYVVQDLDLIKANETLEYFRELKTRKLDWSKLRLVVNNCVKSKVTPKKIKNALTYYIDPGMTFTEEFEEIKKFVEIPLEPANYSNYIDGMEDGKLNLDKFTTEFRTSMDKLSIMAYGLTPGAKKKGFFG